MYKIIFLPAARKDVLKASKWYEDKSEGLRQRFSEAVVNFIETLQKDFVEYGEAYRGLSRIFLKGFPYQVYFKKDKSKNSIVVFAVLYNKQSRTILDKRI